jgi:prepilin-type N-terminal cleavage/methylation domain-containing protein
MLAAFISHTSCRTEQHRAPASGFTLIEVLIAIGLMTATALGVAQLIALAIDASRAAREHTSAVVLAAAKMDQLRGLEWTYEPAPDDVPPVARSDVATDVSDPAFGGGGPGLSPSPAGTLASSIPPYVDYLDEAGSWVGNDATAPPGAVYVRRWAIVPLPSEPDRTLVLHVLVTTVRLERTRGDPWQRRSGVEAFLTSVRTRR